MILNSKELQRLSWAAGFPPSPPGADGPGGRERARAALEEVTMAAFENAVKLEVKMLRQHAGELPEIGLAQTGRRIPQAHFDDVLPPKRDETVFVVIATHASS